MVRFPMLVAMLAGGVLASGVIAQPKPQPQPKSQPHTQPNAQPKPAAAPATSDPSTAPANQRAKPMVDSPHPMICEILYAVPKGDEGDADKDGKRSATGDEFIEIYNPHKVAIDLKGYVLTDAAPLTGPDSDRAKTKSKSNSGKGKSNTTSADSGDDASKPKASTKRSRLRFEFPAVTLQPGEVAVVFNGYESHAAGKVGTADASAGKNESFGNAYVFSMNVKTQFAALANNGDCVTLFAPDGRAIQCVRWGTAEKDKKVDSAILMMEAPESHGSVTLDPVTGEFVEHPAIETDAGQRFFSPGTFGEAKAKDSDAKPAGKK